MKSLPDGVAEHVLERIGFADGARLDPHHDHQLDLVVELVGDLRGQLHRAAVARQGVVVLVEQHRHFRHRRAHFRGMLAVVQAHADDLLRMHHRGTELDLVLGKEMAARPLRRERLLQDHADQLAAAFAQHLVDRMRDIVVEGFGGAVHVEHALVGPDRQSQALAALDVAHRELERQVGLVGASLVLFVGSTRRSGRAGCHRGCGGAHPYALEKRPAAVLHGLAPPFQDATLVASITFPSPCSRTSRESAKAPSPLMASRAGVRVSLSRE